MLSFKFNDAIYFLGPFKFEENKKEIVSGKRKRTNIKTVVLFGSFKVHIRDWASVIHGK